MKHFVVLLLIPLLLPAAWAEDQSQKLLATYDNRSLTFGDFAELEPSLASWVGVTLTPEQIEDRVDDIIFAEVTAKEAEKIGLADTPEVRTQITKILATAYWKKNMPREGLAVAEEDVQKYYDENREQFRSIDQVKVSQILTKSEDEAAKLRQAITSGQSFEELARKHSLDATSAKRGGSMGTINPLQLLPEIREALTPLTPGQVSAPVRSNFGYHVVRLDARPEGIYQPLDEVKKDIFNRLVREKQKAIRENVRKELWGKYDVHVRKDAIAELLAAKTSENVHVEKASLGRQLRKPGQATELQAITESVELGKIPGKKVTESVLLMNASDKILSVHRVGSTCKCIEASIDKKQISPAQSAKLTFTYDPDMGKEKGLVQKTLFIESSDYIEPRKFIRISADIVRK